MFRRSSRCVLFVRIVWGEWRNNEEVKLSSHRSSSPCSGILQRCRPWCPTRKLPKFLKHPKASENSYGNFCNNHNNNHNNNHADDDHSNNPYSRGLACRWTRLFGWPALGDLDLLGAAYLEKATCRLRLVVLYREPNTP